MKGTKPTRITFVESPFNHARLSRLECARYALWCCVDATNRGECVFASHLFFTLFIAETKGGRDWGLACRDALAKAAMPLVARYQDIGETPGMYRDVDCTAVVESRTLTGAAKEGWASGAWPEGSLTIGS